MTHEPDISRPLPGVTPEQRLIDLADAEMPIRRSTIKALAEVVRAALDLLDEHDYFFRAGDCDAGSRVRTAIQALDSQEEQQS